MIERRRQSSGGSYQAGFDAALLRSGWPKQGGAGTEGSDAPEALDHGGDEEVEYVSYSIEKDRDRRLAVSVVLTYQGFEASGTHVGPVFSDLRDQAIAKATLQALSHLRARMGSRDQNLTLHGVKEVKAVGRCFVLVAVQDVGDRETKTLAGAIQVEDSRDLAVIRATIQAVDRRIRSLH